MLITMLISDHPTKLTLKDLWTAAKACEKAEDGSPFKQWISGGDGIHEPTGRSHRRASMCATMLLSYMWYGRVQAIDRGRSLGWMTPPPETTPPPSRSYKVFLAALLAFAMVLRKRTNPLSVERHDNGGKQTELAMQALWGERLSQMFLLDGIFTNPEFQNRGYAGKILDSYILKAEGQKRAMVTFFTGVDQDLHFFTKHGFVVAETIYLGKDDPDWKVEPIPIRLLIREPSEKKKP